MKLTESSASPVVTTVQGRYGVADASLKSCAQGRKSIIMYSARVRQKVSHDRFDRSDTVSGSMRNGQRVDGLQFWRSDFRKGSAIDAARTSNIRNLLGCT